MARLANRKAVSSPPAIANIDEQLDEVVMDSKVFMKDCELLALAPLTDVGDSDLFSKQKVSLIDEGEIQWDFILHNGEDLHFRNKLIRLQDGALSAFKKYMRSALRMKLEE
ncbi:hypothetical protein ABI244_05570 [Serratia ureilytica]|uniref:hypothetical protein n=1 Tax=Serratia ureilytica TaxID=300181 RepID=UPI0032672FB0